MKIEMRGQFLLTPSEDEKNVLVLRDNIKILLEDSKQIIIKQGTKTNGLTIPLVVLLLLPFIRLIFPRWHPYYSNAVICHDAMVGEYKGNRALLTSPSEASRRLTWDEATKVTLELLKLSGCSIMHTVVIINSIKTYGKLKYNLKRFSNGFNKTT